MAEEENKKEKKTRNTVTALQEAAFRKYLEKIKNGERPILKDIMISVGYSPKSAVNAKRVLGKGWALLKKELDTEGALQTFNDLVSKKNSDKRTRLAAAIEVTKITGGYPAADNKVVGFFGNLDSLRKKEDDNDIRQASITEENQLLSPPGTN